MVPWLDLPSVPAGRGYTGYASFTSAGFSLFGPSGPTYSDVYQGNLGDCTVMAAMAEVAARNPAEISSMFINNGDGTYTVRFFNPKGSPIYVTVNSLLPVSGAFTIFAHPEGLKILWPALLEKAYAQLNEEGWLSGTLQPGVNSYTALDSGDAATSAAALSAISGSSSGCYNWNPSLFNESQGISMNWNAGDLIVLGTGDPEAYPLVPDHAYALIGINPDGSFEFFNPWGLQGGILSGQFYPGLVKVYPGALNSSFTGGAVAASAPEAVGSEDAHGATAALAVASRGPANPDAASTISRFPRRRDSVAATEIGARVRPNLGKPALENRSGFRRFGRRGDLVRSVRFRTISSPAADDIA